MSLELSNEIFLTQKQLLQKLPIARRTLTVWRANGKIPFVKLQRKVLYHWPSVEKALLKVQKNTPPA